MGDLQIEILKMQAILEPMIICAKAGKDIDVLSCLQVISDQTNKINDIVMSLD